MAKKFTKNLRSAERYYTRNESTFVARVGRHELRAEPINPDPVKGSLLARELQMHYFFFKMVWHRVTNDWSRVVAVGGIVVVLWSMSLVETAARGEDLSHELGKIKVSDLRETSGVAASRLNDGVLWLHNDGPTRHLYGVSTSGKLVAMLTVDADLVDLEEIAVGPGPRAGVEYLYLGDIGDNSARRREVRLIRFPEPKLAGPRGQQLTVENVEVIRLKYPDGPHNAEAFVIAPDTGELTIVTKENGGARLYTAEASALGSGRMVELESAGSIGFEKVSGGTISGDGTRILLRREGEGRLWHREQGQSSAVALTGKPTRIEVRGKRQGPNGEAVSLTHDGKAYYTVSEGKNQSIYRFEVP